MKRRNIVRIISFLCAVILTLTGFIIKDRKKAEKLKLQIENGYSENINGLSASVNDISLLLQKIKYVNEPSMLSKMAAEILTETEIAKTSLSQLPLSQSLDSLNLFLSQVGNYAFAVSRQSIDSGKLPDDFAGNITKLSNTSEKIAEIVNTAQIGFDNAEYWIKEIDKEAKNESDNLGKIMNTLEGEFEDYPTLVYDGPYSDEIIESEPKMLENAGVVEESVALVKAQNFIKYHKLKTLPQINGKIECYHFGDSQNDITVSKKGGYIVDFRKIRAVQTVSLSYSQALVFAKKFLESKSLNNFLETYYYIDEGVCVINFAFLDNGTICYTDLIKVGIAMDNGETVFYEAGGYIANHKAREIMKPKFTEADAKEKVSNELKIKKVSKAIIPTDSGEKECYEFLCIDTDTEVLVYINTQTLKQEDILILLKSDGGTLAK